MRKTVVFLLLLIALVTTVNADDNKFRADTDAGKPVRVRIPGEWSGDSLLTIANVVWGTAAEITRPGYLYYLTNAKTWSKADTSVITKGQAVALDTVASGAQCRFQLSGPLTLPRYRGLWAPGTELVSDSLIAGWLSPTDSLRSPEKKMHSLATSLDSTTGKIYIRIAPGFWIRRAQ